MHFAEIGAGFAAYVDGECVIDVVAGHADPARTKAYTAETLNPIFSNGKAVMAIVVAKLVSEGRLSYSDTMAKHWPEFAAGGKEGVTVSDVLAHIGGVAWVDPDRLPTAAELSDLDALAQKIAGQPHNYPGQRLPVYHAALGGCFLNEVVRRADPKNRSCGQILREDIVPLLNSHPVPAGTRPAEIYCGLPSNVDRSRIALMRQYPTSRLLARAILPGFITGDPLPKELLAIRKDKHLMNALASIPPVPKGAKTIFQGGLESFDGEASSFNMISNASSLARLASVMALGGSPVVNTAAFEEAHSDVQPAPVVCLGRKMAVGGLGIINKKSPVLSNGFANEESEDYKWFGWHGAGGSVFQWCPNKKIGVSYVMNAMNPYFGGDDRGGRCIMALVDCIEKAK